MIKRIEGLLERMGLKRETGKRSIVLDATLHTALVEQAEREQRTAEELYEDLLGTALAQRQRYEELWQRWQALSPREKDASAFTCLGYTNRQIAAKMDISPGTVKAYVRQILVKFGYHSKYELQICLGKWDFSKWGPKAQE